MKFESRIRSLFLSKILILFVMFFHCGCINNFKPEQIVGNFQKHKKKIFAIDKFFRQKQPIYVEFINKNTINILIRKKLPNGFFETVLKKWDTSISDNEVIAAIKKIGWSIGDLNKLYTLLSDVNCISIGYLIPAYVGIENVIELGYKRSWPKMYAYILFPNNLSKEAMENTGEALTYDGIHFIESRIGWCALRGGFG